MMFRRNRKYLAYSSPVTIDSNGFWRDRNGYIVNPPTKVDPIGMARVCSMLAVAGGLALAVNLGNGGAVEAAAISQPTIHEQARMPEPVGPDYAAAAQPARSTKQRDCLVQLAYHEARSESRESIVKRVWTAVWRARRDDFAADTICEAVFKRGAFSAFLKGIPPMRDKVALARVSKIVDSQMPAILPDLYGGTKCVEYDHHTGVCAYTVADTIPTPPVMTYYAEADCYYLGRKGYRYVKRGGICQPRWAAKMNKVTSVKCATPRRRRCATIFWLAGGNY